MLMVLLASVYLNGVNIDGLRSQTFEKCRSVKIDDRGDVRLDCPAYQVESQPTPLATAGLATSITKHYWLVTEQNDGAAAQYDVDVFVNSKWVRKVKSGDGQMVL